MWATYLQHSMKPRFKSISPSLALLQDSDCPEAKGLEIAEAMPLWSLSLRMLPR